MDVTISAQNGGGDVTYADNGSFAGVGKWIEGGLDSLLEGSYHNLIQKVNTAGLDGSGTKNFGFRGARLVLKVVYVDSSEQALEKQWKADSLAMSGNPVTLTYGTFTGTAILVGTVSQLTKIKSVPVGGWMRATAEIVFELVRIGS